MKITRPAVRYYGGKWKLAEWIISHFGSHRVYTEAFSGPASVFLQKRPSEVEVLNDRNGEVVNFFRVLQEPRLLALLIDKLNKTPFAREEYEAAVFGTPRSRVERARQFMILCEMSHNAARAQVNSNSGFRTTTAGHHNLPRLWADAVANLEAVAERLRSAIIENTDYRPFLLQHDREEALHYVDPPYLGKLRAENRRCYKHELRKESEHLELLELLLQLKGAVVLSGYPDPLYRDNLPGWLMVTQNAVSSAAKRGKSNRVECLFLNPKAAESRAQFSLFDLNQ